ncbi:zf-HC2 domain-containing protein (plasmid) [Streptomyces sp. G6]|uniref:zf-HC2 domain-containing protein n=1 Tax=Streptomyces sp. G6 TaxID=1178736 RepID=UPI003ED9679B
MPKPSTGCDEIREWLGAYVVGALEPDEQPPIRAHLACCHACRSERDDLADVVRLLRGALPVGTAAQSPRPARRSQTDASVRPEL